MQKLIPALLAALLLAACGKEESAPAAKQAASAPAAQAAGPAASGTRDEPATAVIETENYVMKIHRAIPFVPKNDPLGMLKTKEGHHYVVLDISVRNKGSQPFEMGSVMLTTKIMDDSGKSYAGHIGALTAYLVEHPDPNHDAEYEGVWSTELKPGEFHRALALGAEVPNDVKTLTIAAPVRPYDVKDMKQTKISL